MSVLRALQLADSGFPSGGFAFSWGLERASELGRVTPASFADWLATEMLGRWAEFDRIQLARAFRESDPLTVDAETDRLFLAEPLRKQSAQAGQALLTALSRLDDPVATALRTATMDGQTTGHLPVVQGAVFRSLGLDLTLALAVSAHAAAQGLISAAIRLGLVGALDAQHILQDLQSELSPLTTPPPAEALPASFAPISEIAMMRLSDGRLFAN